jgi:hypothetical protein
MNDICFGLALSLIFVTSAWGWGQAFATVYRLPILRLGAFTTVLGLAVLSFIGGILNLVGLAKSATLVSLVLLGGVFSIVVLLRNQGWRRAFRSSKSSVAGKRWLSLTPVFMALAITIFMGACLMPTSILNFHDDFHTYLPRVIRILESGSIAGNPFDGMGLDSLGTQSFFQGFFISIGGPRLAHGFDAVCCLFLTMLLIAQCTRIWRLPLALQILAVAAAAVITPQSVNISPLYSSVLVTLALLVWGSALAKQMFVSGQTARGMECAGALLVALLLCLKVTVATFAAVHLAVLYMVLFATSSRKLATAKSAMLTALLSVVFVLPWFLTHWPGVQHASEIGAAFRAEGLLPANSSMAAHDVRKLLSVGPLFYGDSLQAFHFLVLTCVAAALASTVLLWKLKGRSPGFANVISAGLAVAVVYLLNAHMFAYENAVRYSVPVLIGCFLFVPMFLCRLVMTQKRWSKALMLVSAAVMIAAVAVFARTGSQRMWLAKNEHHSLQFPVNADYLNYCQESFSRAEAARAIEIQNKIPPGAKVFVWMATPFHLDFGRNQLMTMTDPGLINPALHFPTGVTPPRFAIFLEQWKAGYVLLDVRGFGIKDVPALASQAKSEDAISRKLAERGIYLRQVLAAIGSESDVIHADNRTVLFKLNPMKAAP